MRRKKHLIFEYFIIASGASLPVVTELRGGDPNIWYVLWALFPYIAYYLASSKSKSAGAIIGGGVLILGFDILIRIQVFYLPGSSTDAIALLTMPFWQSVIIMPIGFLLGWFVEKLVKKAKSSNMH